MTEQEHQVLCTTNANLSIYILAKTGKIPEVYPQLKRPNKAEFRFPADDIYFRAATEFTLNAPIPVQNFLDAQRLIRDMMMKITRGESC